MSAVRRQKYCFAALVVLWLSSLSASGQSGQLKEPADKTDVGVAIKQLTSGTQTEGAAGVVVSSGQSQPIRFIPFGRKAGSGIQSQAPAGALLTYWGGPVISNIQVVVVFWGPNVVTTSAADGTATLGQFFTDITTSRYFDLLTEYTTAGRLGPDGVSTSNQTIGEGTFAGAVTITPSICPGPTACTVTDAQIKTELTNQINAGHLPAPQADVHGIVNTYYAIYFPPGITIQLDAVTRSCVNGGFCAYHSNTGSNIPYGVMPDFSSGGCSLGCGGGTVFQRATNVSSHEMAEAITDAQVGSATVFGPPLGWYDNPPNLGEVADLCDPASAAVSAGANSYTVEPLFSNLQNNCVTAPPVFNLSGPATGAGPAIAFNGSLTIQSSLSPFTLTGYTGTVHFTSSDAQAVLPADYTFVAADAGTHTFSFTLKTLGDQTITATDTRSSGFRGSTTVNVNVTPDLMIAKSHTGNFSVGQVGATYSLTVSNIGHGPTVGTVTATDALPAGLSATAISGTGWSCTLGTLTCTRADALAAGNSYPAITVTVNVAANAGSPLTNTATVSGGGELNTANDSASDQTLVLAPDLNALKQHVGAVNGAFFQGETGATYTITITNFGNLATIGTVTVVDTLPAAGLTATDISGTGWSCTLATLTCTRSDTLASGNVYPVITVTVNVALDAPANVVNTATVSGGGEVNTANDVSQDATVILPPLHPDLTPFMNHSTNFVQGTSGSFYRIDISNVGTASTSGAVTVSDTLPTGLTATDVSGVGWTCTIGATSSCTQSTPLLFNNSYAPIIITVSIAADAPTSVVNTVTVSGGGDTVLTNNSASDPTSIATPLVDLAPSVAGSAFEAQGATGATYTMLVQNMGNVSTNGSTITAVTNLSTGITATALSGTGWTCTLSTLTCTRSDALIPFGIFPITVTVDFAKNAPATGSVGETVSGGGDGNAANNTSSEFVTIQPMLGITGLSSAQTVTAGTAALYQMIVNPLTIAGPATMSCSGLPTAATCTFNPSIAPAGVGGSLVVMTINTTAHSGIVPGLRGPGNNRPLLPLLFLLTTALAALLLRHRLAQQGGRLKPALALTGLLLLAALSGCGGGGPPPPPPVIPGTPAGTYSVTVNATSPNATATSTVTLTVR